MVQVLQNAVSHTKLLTSRAYQLKQFLSHLHTEHHFCPSSPFVCKLARVAVLTNYGFAKF